VVVALVSRRQAVGPFLDGDHGLNGCCARAYSLFGTHPPASQVRPPVGVHHMDAAERSMRLATSRPASLGERGHRLPHHRRNRRETRVVARKIL
jgi:hypothetical protein